jgi:hypothetical protein
VDNQTANKTSEQEKKKKKKKIPDSGTVEFPS